MAITYHFGYKNMKGEFIELNHQDYAPIINGKKNDVFVINAIRPEEKNRVTAIDHIVSINTIDGKEIFEKIKQPIYLKKGVAVNVEFN